MSGQETETVIGLGSSLGDRTAQLRLAVAALDAHPALAVVVGSRLWCSVPVGVGHGLFLNAAVRIRARCSPWELLAICKRIEEQLGRRPSRRWGDRSIDLDILLFGDYLLVGPYLSIPHAQLLQRPFALIPAAEVSPEACLPGQQRPLSALPMAPVGMWPVGVLCAPAVAPTTAQRIPSDRL